MPDLVVFKALAAHADIVGALQIRFSNILFLSPASEIVSNNAKYSAPFFVRKALINSIQPTTSARAAAASDCVLHASYISPSSPSDDKGAGGLSADTAAALSGEYLKACGLLGAGDLTVDAAAECLGR